MTTLAALAATVILAGLAVFQIALAAGAPIGRFAWGGQHRVLPTKLRVASAVSVLLYAAFAVIILQRAEVITLISDVISRVGIWILTGYFTLGIVMNGISRSKPERNLMTPVCAVLAVLCLVIALS
ncbi:hypothetical protein [Mycetocola zhadangensis]|uniref:Integral membrane protein n=1 Tax=Mycetocola zhadangensis TaxID=1164595 RepID=A0A3L7IZ21_9MICO|nr:hypothetical protein [Mycetocola zhadangensis]RLQ82831.1 hypothetical protein D9V28_12090 [Mycetocola zhadangensis]GGE99078.1 hypothetical protein GCM10011313_22560 [Mycetocola zhadangensis]